MVRTFLVADSVRSSKSYDLYRRHKAEKKKKSRYNDYRKSCFLVLKYDDISMVERITTFNSDSPRFES